MAADYWVFPRGPRFVFAWAPDPTKKSQRKQKMLPEHLKTKREANAYAATNEDRLKEEPAKRAHTGTLTIADLEKKWLDLRAKDDRFAGSTFRDAKSHLKRWIVPMLGTRAVPLDVPTVRAWVRELRSAPTRRGRTIAPYTIRNILRSLRWVLADAIGEGWIMGPNPADAEAVADELPKDMEPLAGHSQKLRIVRTQDAQRLLECPYVPLQWRVRYAVAMLSGLRDGELSGLRVRAIDEQGIHVRGALQLKTRKLPGTTGHAKIGKTKTKQSLRTVPCHPAARAFLEEWLQEGWEVHVGHHPGPDDFVFVRHNGKPWRPRAADVFRKHLELAGLATHIEGHALTFHALRRAFSNFLRAAGVPVEARQALMGHAPKSAEQKHYSEEDPTMLVEFVGRIGIVWRRVQETPAPVCAEPKLDDKPMQDRPRVRKTRRDRES